MNSVKLWLSDKLHIRKHGDVRFPIMEPEAPPHPWSLESPFTTWTVYTKVSFSASIFCFVIFLVLCSRGQLNGVTKALSRRTSAPGLKVYVAPCGLLLGSFCNTFVGLLVVFLFLSIPWEWVRLYQIEVAKKMAILSEGYENSCSTDNPSVWRTIKTGFLWCFSWHGDSCENYYKALLVDPFWEVTPGMVITSSFGRIIQYPFELMAQTIGRSIRHTMKEIPSQWQPVIFLLVAVVFVAVVAIYFRWKQKTIIYQAPPGKARCKRTK